MTCRELTELQNKLRNAAHTSAIMHRVEMNGWNQLDHSRRRIVAGDGSRPERDGGRSWMTRDGSRPEMNRNRIWMDDRGGRQEMDLRSWNTGDG